ncbi:MAG TPA: PilZ domain-containing protein [Rhizomicrobium sp.]|nr:PilZ domain-containing protein [Rhizomicrobium sp.]
MNFLDFYHVGDRRTHRRFAVGMSARLYHANGRFSLCSTADLSLAGAAINLDTTSAEPITAFGCDETGKLTVTRFHVAKPFVRLVFDATSETRAVIKRALHSLGDRQMVQPAPVRRGERLATRNVMVTRADGSHLLCDIIDMSPRGMLLGSNVRPPLGERVSLGKVGGLVVRHHDQGFVMRMHERSPDAASNVVRFPMLYRAPAPAPASSFDNIA